MSGEWLENWYSEAEALFEQLPTVPPGLEKEIQKLLAWKARSAKVADEYWQARERLWLKRMEREDARNRLHAIAERQRIATEMEIAERRLRKWQHKLQNLKDEIDRITDEIISEMRRRHERAMLEAALLADARMQQKAEDDLRVWEIFRRGLENAASRPSTRKERERRFKTIEQRRQEAEEKRLRQEYEAFLRREAASHEDNQAAWQAFLNDEFVSPVHDTPPKAIIPPQNDDYGSLSSREEFETFAAHEMPPEGDDDAAWREFIEEEFSRFPYSFEDDEDLQ